MIQSPRGFLTDARVRLAGLGDNFGGGQDGESVVTEATLDDILSPRGGIGCAQRSTPSGVLGAFGTASFSKAVAEVEAEVAAKEAGDEEKAGVSTKRLQNLRSTMKAAAHSIAAFSDGFAFNESQSSNGDNSYRMGYGSCKHRTRALTRLAKKHFGYDKDGAQPIMVPCESTAPYQFFFAHHAMLVSGERP